MFLQFTSRTRSASWASGLPLDLSWTIWWQKVRKNEFFSRHSHFLTNENSFHLSFLIRIFFFMFSFSHLLLLLSFRISFADAKEATWDLEDLTRRMISMEQSFVGWMRDIRRQQFYFLTMESQHWFFGLCVLFKSSSHFICIDLQFDFKSLNSLSSLCCCWFYCWDVFLSPSIFASSYMNLLWLYNFFLISINFISFSLSSLGFPFISDIQCVA